jgi:sulfoxide reductase heme-binding subunit YedZ
MLFTRLKWMLFVVGLVPILWLVFGLFTNKLGVNPIETLIRDSGTWALRFLIITLAITPLRWFTGLNQLIAFRRMLGLYAFFYAVVHMMMYLGLDQFFDVSEIIKDIIKRPFITVGFVSFVLLIPLAVTSTNKMMKRLGGKNWKRLHKTSYFIAAAACLHFYMLARADKSEPLLYIAIISVLMLVRVYHFVSQHAQQKSGLVRAQH